MKVTVDTDDLKKDLVLFYKNINRATSKSINESVRASRTKAIANMRKSWKGIKAKDLKANEKTFVKPATTNNLYSRFILISKPIPLSNFGAVQKIKGVSYKLKSNRRTMKHAFIAKKQVFVRRTKKNDSIVRRVSITPTSMFLGTKSDEVFLKTFDDKFEKNLRRNLKYYMSK